MTDQEKRLGELNAFAKERELTENELTEKGLLENYVKTLKVAKPVAPKVENAPKKK